MHRSWPNQGTASTWRCLSGSDDRWEVAHPQPLSRPQHHQHSTKPIALGLYPSSWANWWSQGNLSGNSTGKKRKTKWTQISNSTKRCYPDKRVENAFHSQTHMSEKMTGVGIRGRKHRFHPALVREDHQGSMTYSGGFCFLFWEGEPTEPSNTMTLSARNSHISLCHSSYLELFLLYGTTNSVL